MPVIAKLPNFGLSGKRKMTFRLRTVAATAFVVSLAPFASAQAEDLVFTLTNGTNSVLSGFYTSPTGVDSWEEDVLNPGESVEVTIADGRSVCKYDMKFVFTEDSDLDTTTDTQDLCDLGSYEITE